MKKFSLNEANKIKIIFLSKKINNKFIISCLLLLNSY